VSSTISTILNLNLIYNVYFALRLHKLILEADKS